MATNLSALAPITTAATALSNLILVTPQSTIGYQPQNPPNSDGTPSTAQQPPALLFHYEGEQTITVESDITDHYVEDNTAIQDQIALRPEVVTTHGFIGELNDVAPFGLQTLKTAADKLTTIGAYTPQLTESALIAYSEAFLLYQVAANAANTAVAAWDSLTGQAGESVIDGQGITRESNQNRQQAMFQQLYGYWRERRLFTVQTPWAVFKNMAILHLKPIQDAETRVITEFELTFKMIRTAAELSAGESISLSGRLSTQGAAEQDIGTGSPTQSIGLGTGLSNMGVA